MIRFADAQSRPAFERALGACGLFGTKIHTQYRVYGLGGATADFWLLETAGEITGLLLRQGRTLTLGGSADLEELTAFLRAMAGACVEGPAELLEPLSATLGGVFCPAWILGGAGSAPPKADPRISIRRADALAPVYELLCLGDTDFRRRAPYDGWLAETSHKLRHDLADIWLLALDGREISTVGVYERDETYALLSSGATDPAFRGRGYFRSLLSYAAKEVCARGLSPRLVAETDALAAFYRRCGFTDTGRWGRILLE